MKTIKTGAFFALVSGLMYYCFVNGAPDSGTRRIFYMVMTGIFCIFACAAATGITWYIRKLQKRKEEYEEMIRTLLKNTDKLDK